MLWHTMCMLPLTFSRLLGASVVAAFIGLGSYFIHVSNPEATISVQPTTATASVGGEIKVHVVVESSTPVNAFAGELHFDPTQLAVSRIDYNNSIADLWAEKPWYENGAGTINFAGGSTQPGGFVGSGILITVAFTTKSAGVSAVEISKAQILRHDGLGSDIPLNEPVDALFTITPDAAPVIEITSDRTQVVVASEGVNLDLNNDGRVSLGDVSVFLQYLVTGDLRGDLNGDGRVSLTDMSILLDAI